MPATASSFWAGSDRIPAFLNNWCYAFLARDVYTSGNPDPDETEDLELVQAPLSGIPDLIARGEIDHSLILSAFYLYFMKDRPRGDNTKIIMPAGFEPL